MSFLYDESVRTFRTPALEFRRSESLLRNVPEGRCDRSLARSAWDSTIPKEPSRRARFDSCSCGHRFDDWSAETLRIKHKKCMFCGYWPSFKKSILAFLKKHGRISTRNTSGVSSTIPYPTGRFFRGTLSQPLRVRLRSVLSLRDALVDISQQHLVQQRCLRLASEVGSTVNK
jgi:hypothetical protein